MKNRKPMHIGIIPDGNRRWAEQHKLSREAGYAYGLKPGLLLLQQAKTYGIQEITYYGFTVDNCRRPKEQVQAFQQACVQSVYADFYVEEKLWLDYEKSDFYRAMDWYKKQDVTYGG